MSTQYPGGFITKSPVAPTSSAASGIWTVDQAMQYKKDGTWPLAPYPLVMRVTPQSSVRGVSTAGTADSLGNLFIPFRYQSGANYYVGTSKIATTTPTQTWTTYYKHPSTDQIVAPGTFYPVSNTSNWLTSWQDRVILYQYDNSGALVYAMNQNPIGWTDVSSSAGGPIAVDSTGKIYVSYYSKKPYGITSITKFPSGGTTTPDWSKAWTTSTDFDPGKEESRGNNRIKNLFTDASDNVYGSGDFSSSTFASAAERAGIVSRNSSGDVRWQKVYTSTITTGPMTYAFINANSKITALFGNYSTTTDGILIMEIEPSTGEYSGTIKKTLTVTGNAGFYNRAQGTHDSSKNVYVTWENDSNSFYIAKVNSTATTATAIKITQTGGSVDTSKPSWITTDGTWLYINVPYASAAAAYTFKISTTLADSVGKTVTYSGVTATIASATASLASNAFSEIQSIVYTAGGDLGGGWGTHTPNVLTPSPTLSSVALT